MSLTSCFNACSKGKGNCLLCDGLLYHDDHVLGHKVHQLCAPLERRDYILKLAHDTVFNNHMAYRKTKERIRLSLWWPKLSKDVADYCMSCTSCQQRRHKVAIDRVPITPMPRAELPFQHITMDCIEPIDPPSSKSHKYCLCIVDSCTRWPAVYPLKRLDAGEVCDAIIYLFKHTGIAIVISSDNSSNFVNKLIQKFEARLECSPRFNTSGHPEASGVCERWNASLKNALHHAIRESPREWHKVIPCIAWAYREVSNSTAGMTLYMLLYGRLPKGPLTILKDSWAGELELPPNLGKYMAAYLQELKENLEIAAFLLLNMPRPSRRA